MPVSQKMENDVPTVFTDTQGDGGEELGSVELPDEDGGRD